jgi:tRNA threonylcarbamoyladenosine biosynthesis protein TsaB
MAKILLIETATEVCSAAISVDGVIFSVAEDLNSSSHASLLTLQIEHCARSSGIALNQLDAIALSRGPGAYTALRVGASVAKGICYALNKPLLAVDTLQALAMAASQETTGQFFVPMLDARRQEVWLAVFDKSLSSITDTQPLILENNLFDKFMQEMLPNAKPEEVVMCGNGMKKISSGVFFEKAIFSEVLHCSAKYLAALAEKQFQARDFLDWAYFEPFYMKPPNITTPNKVVF